MTFHHSRIGALRIPPMALGAMYFGTRVPADRSAACLDTAFDAGARFWDTANNYAFWAGGVGDESEEVIGQWLSGRGDAVRDQIVLATKVGARPCVAGGDLGDALGLSAEAIRRQVQDSLTRLRTDHLDVLYAHVDDAAVPLEETLGAFSQLVEQGLVREIAASNLTAERLMAAMTTPGSSRYQALQQRFTYLAPSPSADLRPHVLLDDHVSDLCDRYRLTRLGYSPLLSGAYTRPDRPLPEGYPRSERALATLTEVAGAHGLDAGQTVLSWMVGRHQPVIPVVGVSRPEQVTSAWRAVTTPLAPDELTRLEEARRD